MTVPCLGSGPDDFLKLPFDAIFDAVGRRNYWVTAHDYLSPPDYLATGKVWLVPTMDGWQRLETPVSETLNPAP